MLPPLYPQTSPTKLFLSKSRAKDILEHIDDQASFM